MAWKILIDSVDKTTSVRQPDGVQWTYTLNNRGTARFKLLPGYVPDKYDPVTIYAQDGVTPVWGGVVTKRTVEGIIPESTVAFTSIECNDWSVYADWCYYTKSYASPVSLQTVISDLVTAKLSAYGVTYTPVSYGVTLEPFNVSNIKVSDFLRDLTTKTKYAFRWSPAKDLSASIPGTDPAPYSFTDAATNCRSLTWTDSPIVSANKVILLCGPSGSVVRTQNWTKGTGETSWEVDIQTILGGWQQGYLRENPGASQVDRTISPPGQGGYYYWDQTDGKGTVSVGLGSVPADGTVLQFIYTASYPFEIIKTSGVTPYIEYLASDDKITELAEGDQKATSILDEVDQSAREVTAVTLLHGWQVTQAITVSIASRLTGSMSITQVSARLVSDTYWEYTLLATASTFQGVYLDRWRALLAGSASSGAASVSGGGAGGVVIYGTAPAFYFGGSRSFTVAPSTWTPIPEWVPVRAPTGYQAIARLWLWTRNGSEVTARVVSGDDGITYATAVITLTAVSSSSPVERSGSFVAEAGKYYRVEVNPTVAGEPCGCIGHLEPS